MRIHPASKSTSLRRTCDTTVGENLKVKDIRSLTCLISSHSSNDFDPDVTHSSLSNVGSTQRGSPIKIPTNTDSLNAKVPILNNSTQPASWKELYSMSLQHNVNLHGVESVFRKPTDLVRTYVGITSNAQLTMASLFVNRRCPELHK